MRANTHAVPTPLLTFEPPTMTMLPSLESATEDAAITPVPTSFGEALE
jgi:hypothetical protein